MGFPGGSVVKILLPMQNTQVQSLGQEVPLEEERATPSSILAWEISCTEEPGGATVHGVTKELNMTEIKKISVSTRMSGDWNGIYLTGSL